jgi:two-component system chemotaxis response regulator CheB
MNKTRVLVVDDSAFMRRTLPGLLADDPSIVVVGTAADGEEGVRLVKELRPDVVTMDVLMPVMDGLTALKHIMAEAPTPVVMVSSVTSEGAQATLEALSLGAVDFVTKPSGPVSLDIAVMQRELLRKIKLAAGVDVTRQRFADLLKGMKVDRLSRPTAPAPRAGARDKRLVAIGCSTGGPAALQVLLPNLPGDLGASVLIVQHIAAGFTRPLAARLDGLSAITVCEAEDDMPVTPGVALISPADVHMTVARRGGVLRVRLGEEPAGTAHRPSVDVLFRSIAACCAAEACGVILTGMGDDGALGMRDMHDNGAWTLAQDEASSVIYGMPRRALELGGVSLSLALEDMAAEIARATSRG